MSTSVHITHTHTVYAAATVPHTHTSLVNLCFQLISAEHDGTEYNHEVILHMLSSITVCKKENHADY